MSTSLQAIATFLALGLFFTPTYAMESANQEKEKIKPQGMHFQLKPLSGVQGVLPMQGGPDLAFKCLPYPFYPWKHETLLWAERGTYTKFVQGTIEAVVFPTCVFLPGAIAGVACCALDDSVSAFSLSLANDTKDLLKNLKQDFPDPQSVFLKLYAYVDNQYWLDCKLSEVRGKRTYMAEVLGIITLLSDNGFSPVMESFVPTKLQENTPEAQNSRELLSLIFSSQKERDAQGYPVFYTLHLSAKDIFCLSRLTFQSLKKNYPETLEANNGDLIGRFHAFYKMHGTLQKAISKASPAEIQALLDILYDNIIIMRSKEAPVMEKDKNGNFPQHPLKRIDFSPEVHRLMGGKIIVKPPQKHRIPSLPTIHEEEEEDIL